jgi:hypothetical protein
MVYINAKTKNKTTSVSKVEKKKLDEELEKKHSVLKLATDTVEQKKSEYSILLVGVSALRDEKINLAKEVFALEQRKLLLLQGEKDYDIEHSRKIVGYSTEIIKTKKRKTDIETEIGALMAKKMVIENEVYFLAKNRDILASLQKDIEEMSGEKERFLKWYNEQNSQIEKDKEEVSQLIEKNGKILTDTEKTLGMIDLYAKRLQGYYDEAKININILEQFNIKNK